MLLLVPLVYLVLALAAIQGGSLAVEGAARHAARVAVLTGDHADGVDRVVRIALDDYGIDAGEASVSVNCDPAGSCDEPGTRVRVDVVARVRLPLVPEVLGLEQLASVALQGTATQTVSRFAGSG
ncbi:TadE family protein [Agromyces sp. MMS24-K17]|uniref:TadE family protein n=1 Tax=Agromyces sp. MMS24-K17 TaxID=3372850 RepID=UPI003754A950